MVTSKDIAEAAASLRGVARRTPLVWVEALGAHLKLENEQPIGAFKIRGAYNAIRKLPDLARKRGVSCAEGDQICPVRIISLCTAS